MSQKRLPSRQELVSLCGDKFQFAELLMNNTSQLGINKWQGKFFFDLRGERKPSVQVNAGWCFDHGSSERFDLVDLVARAKGLNTNDLEQFKEAIREAELMITGRNEASYAGITNTYVNQQEYLPAVPRDEIQQWYRNKNLNPEKFHTLLAGLMRSSSDEERAIAVARAHFGLYIEDKVSKKTSQTYKDERLLIPYVSSKGEVFSYGAYRRESKVKILKRSQGKPSLAGEHLISSFDRSKPVLWTEGDGDYATALGLGINAVTCGSASMKITSFLPALAGMDVWFLPDNDEAGAKALARWKVEVKDYNDSVEQADQVTAHFLWWSSITWNKAKEVVVDTYRKALERGGMLASSIPEEKIFEHLKVTLDDVVIIETKGVLKKGYDFVDFAATRDELFNNFVSFFTK